MMFYNFIWIIFSQSSSVQIILDKMDQYEFNSNEFKFKESM